MTGIAPLPPNVTELTVEQRGPVALITLLGEERLNAMRRPLWSELRDVLGRCEEDADVSAVVITGSGDRAFSAGGDITGYADLNTSADRRAFIVDCIRTFQAVEDCSLPVIAAVNGVAAGGGFELALACDIVVASSSARLSVPEATVGLVPGFGALRLRDHLGPGWTKYLMMTGESLDASTALQLGLIQRIVEAAELIDTAVAIGEKISQSAPLAITVAKTTINSSLDRRYFGTTDSVVMLQGTDDAAEGIKAFVGKRKPRFTGR